MYRGFNLKKSLTKEEIDSYYPKGKELFDFNQKQVKIAFDKFKLKNKSLDGSAIQASWFPQIDADVFISHSHKNETEVIALAGFLWDKFKIRTFIDSCIWDSAFDLQNELDKEYSLIDPLKTGTFSYSKVSSSSSHVHMMLSTALSLMIDRTECIFFFNTPDSIESYDKIDKTASPWIYSEITTTQIVRKKIPKRVKVIESTRYYSKGGVVNESLRINYKLGLDHLSPMSKNDFERWKITASPASTAINSLDKLYDLVPIKGLTFLV